LLKARGGLSVGNLIGSNILDTLLPVGLDDLVHPLTVEANLVNFDLPFLFALTLTVLVFLADAAVYKKPKRASFFPFYTLYLLSKFFGF
jgi:cation:H+ antiporter